MSFSEKLRDKLEPLPYSPSASPGEVMAQMSMAISARRQADALDRIAQTLAKIYADMPDPGHAR